MTMQNPSFDTIASDTEEIQRRNSAPSTASGWGEIGTKKQAQDPTNFSVMSYGPDASKPGYSSAAGVQYGPLDPKADKTHVIGLGDASSIVDKVFGGPQIRKYVSDPLIGATYGAIAAPIRAIQGKPQPSTSLNPWTQANANFRAAPTAVKVVGEMFTDPRNYALGELGAGFGGLGAGTGKGAAMELGAKATGRDRAFIGNDLGKLGMKGVSGASDELPKPLPDWYQHTPGQPLDDSDKFARRATWDVTSPTPRTPTVKEAESVRGQTGQLLASYPDSPTILARRGEVEAFLATQGKGDIGWARRDIEAARKFWETVYGGLKTSPEYERSIINAEVALSEAEKQLGIVPKAPVTPSANAHIGNIRPPIPPSVPSAAGTMPPLGGLGAGTGKGAAMELGAKMTEENWGRIGSDLAPIAGKATQPVANVLDTLERTLAMNSKNKGFAQQFVSKNITPAFVQRFGDSPFMDLERQANGEWLLGIKTAGWESRVKDMGLTFVRKGDFQSLYRIPAAADLGDSLTKNLALPEGTVVAKSLALETSTEKAVTGQPIRVKVYRGTNPGGPTDEGLLGKGTYYTTDKMYADAYGADKGGVTNEAEITLRKPYVMSDNEVAKIPVGGPPKEFVDNLVRQGYDGIIAKMHPTDASQNEIVVFPKEAPRSGSVPPVVSPLTDASTQTKALVSRLGDAYQEHGASSPPPELGKLPDWYQHTPGQPLDDSDKFARRATWDVTSPTPRTPTVKEAESVRGQTGQLLASYPDSPTILARRGEVEAFLATQGKGDIGWARRDIQAARKFWETEYGKPAEWERSIINAEKALAEAEKQMGIASQSPLVKGAVSTGAPPPIPPKVPPATGATPPLPSQSSLTDRLGQAYQEHALPRAAIEQAKGESRAAKAASMRDVYATQGGKQAFEQATASLAGKDIPENLKTIQPRSFFTPEEQNALHDLVIQKGDPAKPFDIRNNQATLEKIFNGEVVTDKEIEKMSNVLPADVIDILMKKNMSSAGRAWYTAKDLARTPGAILTSGATHFSAVLRTGGFGTTAHPTEAGPALVNMFKSFGSMENTVAIEKGLHLDTPSFLNERGGQTLLEQIKAHPDPAEADAATQALNKAFSKKLVTSDEASAVSKVLGKDVGNGILDTQWRTAAQRTSLYDAPIAGSGGSLVKQDEAALGLAGKRLVDRIPVMGRVIKASSRSYSVYLNDLRDGMFSTLAQGRFDAGQPYNSKGLSDLARYVNRATGRGSLGPLEEQAPLLNAIFFSPRFALSRIQAPYTVIEPGMTNAVRLQAAQDVAKFAAVWGGAITMASMLGAKVEHDHRSSDFGKIHVGNTRLDVLAGFLPEARLAMDIVSGHRGLNPLVGQKKTLGAGAIYDQAKAQSTLQYLRNKLSPVAALTADGVTGTNPIGEEFQATGAGVANQAYHRLTPILVQSINDSVQGNQGEKRGVIGLPSALGIGVQTFRSQTDALNEKSQQMFGKPFADLPATTGNQQKQQVVEALTSGGYYPKNYSKPTQARLNTEKVIEQDFLGGKVYPTGTALRTDLSKVQLLAASVASQSPIASSTATSHQGKVLQGWYDTYKQSKAGQQGLDTQKLDTLQQNYMNSLSQDDKTFLQNNINLAPHSPVIQRLEDLRRTLQDVNYYNRAVFASQQNIDLGNGQKYNDLPVATKALFAQYEAAGASKDWQTKHVIANPTYGAANVSELVKLQAIVDTAKTDWAAKNPMIDAGLTIFYDKPPHTPEAKAAIAFPMADGGTARLSPERQLSVLTVQDSKGKDVPISETAIASLYTAVAAKAHADGISPLEEFAKANPGGNASMAALVDQAKQVVAARGK